MERTNEALARLIKTTGFDVEALEEVYEYMEELLISSELKLKDKRDSIVIAHNIRNMIDFLIIGYTDQDEIMSEYNKKLGDRLVKQVETRF